jgi:hypothetical protein
VAVDNDGRVLRLGSVRHLRPDEGVFEEMLTGWRNQQLSRNLVIIDPTSEPDEFADVIEAGGTVHYDERVAPNRSFNVELHREEPWTWLNGQPPQ